MTKKCLSTKNTLESSGHLEKMFRKLIYRLRLQLELTSALTRKSEFLYRLFLILVDMKNEQYLNISIRHGFLTFCSLVAYFFIMKFLGLIDHQELRALNGVIIFIGVIAAISKMKKSNKHHLNYF